MAKKIVLAGACRTAIGTMGGSLSTTPAAELGSIVIKEAINRAGVPADQVDHVYMGCVIQAGQGQNVARQASIKAGLPIETTAVTVNVVCGSGLNCVNMAAQMIEAGDADIVVAGGMENMSMAPYAMMKGRFGYRMNNGVLVDTMVNDALWDAFNDYHMIKTADNICEQWGLTREEIDEFAAKSQQKAVAAQESGAFDAEIVPVMVKKKKEMVEFKKDEGPRPGTTAESLAGLRCCSGKEGGMVTAGNASGINDGAAAVVVMSEEKAKEFKDNIKDTNTRVLSGMDGLIEAATLENADLVVNSVVGMVGLKPTLAAANAKKDIAFANKETLVTGGKLVCDAVKKNGVKLLPVDSEHSAIFQCLQGMPEKKMLKKLILTASGGPFFGKTVEDLKNVTVNEALNHPNWSMGAKITIDSATMMNKGLEIIEARWLFDVQPENIDVVVHRESIIHSLIEYVDNSVIAQLGLPDMRIPIQYAITYPERYESPVGELSLAQIGKMTFFEPDYDTFKCLRACKKALSLGGVATAIANGANEEANRLFREGKITFLEIGDLVMGAIDNIDNFEPLCVDDVLKADKLAREYVLSKL